MHVLTMLLPLDRGTGDFSRAVLSGGRPDELAASPLMVCGDVEHAVEKLTRVTRGYGFDELLCWTRIGGLDNPKVLRSMELLSDRVMPRVRAEMAQAA